MGSATETALSHPKTSTTYTLSKQIQTKIVISIGDTSVGFSPKYPSNQALNLHLYADRTMEFVAILGNAALTQKAFCKTSRYPSGS